MCGSLIFPKPWITHSSQLPLSQPPRLLHTDMSFDMLGVRVIFQKMTIQSEVVLLWNPLDVPSKARAHRGQEKGHQAVAQQ